MKPTGIKVTNEELEQVKTTHDVSGMFLSGGKPMGDPSAIVRELIKKYNAPEDSALDLRTGELVIF